MCGRLFYIIKRGAYVRNFFSAQPEPPRIFFLATWLMLSLYLEESVCPYPVDSISQSAVSQKNVFPSDIFRMPIVDISWSSFWLDGRCYYSEASDAYSINGAQRITSFSFHFHSSSIFSSKTSCSFSYSPTIVASSLKLYRNDFLNISLSMIHLSFLNSDMCNQHTLPTVIVSGSIPPKKMFSHTLIFL